MPYLYLLCAITTSAGVAIAGTFFNEKNITHRVWAAYIMQLPLVVISWFGPLFSAAIRLSMCRCYRIPLHTVLVILCF